MDASAVLLRARGRQRNRGDAARFGAPLVSAEAMGVATNTIVVGVAAVTGARVFSAVLEPALVQSPLILTACLVCLFLLSSSWLRRLGATE